MKLELVENEEFKKSQYELGLKLAKRYCKVGFSYGLPIALMFSAVFYWFEPDRIFQLAAPFLLVVLISLEPFLQVWLVRNSINRWMMDDSRIKFRGNTVGNLKRKRISGWMIRRLEDLPSSYYSLSVNGWFGGATITLDEREYPLSQIEGLFPVEKRLHFNPSTGRWV